MLELYEELSAISTTERDVPLKKMTTLRVGGEAAYVVYPENEMSLDAIMRIIRKNSIPFKVIGKGSNLLCGDGRYEGVIIRLDRHFTDFFFDGEYVTVQAGCSIIALAQEAAKRGIKRNTLLSAKKKLGITSGKSKLDDGTSFWTWIMPDERV